MRAGFCEAQAQRLFRLSVSGVAGLAMLLRRLKFIGLLGLSFWVYWVKPLWRLVLLGVALDRGLWTLEERPAEPFAA